MTVRFEAEAQLAIRAVSAGAALLEERPDTTAKRKESLRDVVTEADRVVERRIATLLGESSPHPLVAEESYAAEGAARAALESGTTWVVDPIDGTANFVSGLPLYAVSVGLLVDGEPTCGAVLMPASRELFFTYGDASAHVNGRALNVRDVALEDALVAASFSGKSEDPAARLEQYHLFGDVNDGSRGCLRLGSAAVAVCYVASSRLQGAYGLGCRIWDVAGALAVARRAGAEVVLRRDARDPSVVDFVVGSPLVVRGLVARAREKGFLR